MAKKEPLLIEATPDLCTSLHWSLYPIEKHLQEHRPSDSEEARDCRESIEPLFDLMDQVGCRYLPEFKEELIGLCSIKK